MRAALGMSLKSEVAEGFSYDYGLKQNKRHTPVIGQLRIWDYGMSAGQAAVKAAASRRTQNWVETCHAHTLGRKRKKAGSCASCLSELRNRRALFRLEGVDIAHQVADSLLHNGLVVLVQ